MAHTIYTTREIVNTMRRDDGCDSGKGLALLLHEDEDKIDEPDILPGITFDVFIKTLLAFRRDHENEEPPTDHRRYSILVKEVDLASLFNMIQIAYNFRDRLNGKYLMDLTCQTLVNKVKNKTFREIREGFNTDQESFFGPDERILDTPNMRVLYKECTYRHADNILRQRGKELFTKNVMLGVLSLSPFVSEWLSFAADRRKKQCSKYLHELMECTDFERLLEIINTLSLITSADRESADLVDSDTAKYLLEIVSYYEDDDIQCQAVYILSQVSIDKCYDVMANDVIPVLVKLMSHSFYHLGIAAVIALMRIANTSPGCIKVIVNKGGLEAALITAKECRDKQMIICCLAKFLAVVCRSYEPPLDKVEVVVTISEEFFQNKLNSDYHKVQACHTLQYLTYGRDVEIGEKLLHKLVGSIYKFLRVEDTLLASSALGVVGNIARWGNPDTIQVLTLNCVLLLSCLEDIMRWCEFKKFRMEACQIISNIAARSGTLTKDMDDAERELTKLLCSLLEKDDYEVRKEAAWAICNCIYGKRARHVLDFLKMEHLFNKLSKEGQDIEMERLFNKQDIVGVWDDELNLKWLGI